MFLAVVAARSARGAPATSPVTAPALAGEAVAGRAEDVQQEFARFYDATKGALRAYLAAATRDSGLADDLTQESFLRLYTAKRAFAGDEHRRRYLFRIASNLLVDHWRTARRAALPLSDEILATPVAAAFTAAAPDLDARRDLVRAWGKLQPRDRQLVWLAHVEHLDHREIAALAGLRSTSVRVLLFRARRRLAAALTGTAAEQGGKR